MPELRFNDKIYCGSSNQASAISYINEDGSKTTVQDKIDNIDTKIENLCINLESKIQFVTITATTGTDSSVGIIRIPKSQYPGAKAIVPLGLDSTTGYNVYGHSVSGDFTMGVTNVSSRAWASNTTITFQAMIVY